MARKTTATAEAQAKATAKSKAAEAKAAKPREFGLRSRNTPVIFMRERREYGTASLFTKPLYVPPDIEVGWALSGRDDGGINIQDMLSRGWDFVPEEKVTDDLNEAIAEGKICFRGVTISQLGDVENRVGLVNYGLVLMFRNKDVSEKFQNTLSERFKDYFKAYTKSDGNLDEAEITDEERLDLKNA